jgi:hypothetical protein
MRGSVPLGVPETIDQIVIEGEGASVVQNDRTIFTRDGLAPPLVVDAPCFSDSDYLASGFALHAYELGLAMLVGANVDDIGLPQRTEAWPLAHGSKLRRA